MVQVDRLVNSGKRMFFLFGRIRICPVWLVILWRDLYKMQSFYVMLSPGTAIFFVLLKQILVSC
jgi:hypothetical protein